MHAVSQPSPSNLCRPRVLLLSPSAWRHVGALVSVWSSSLRYAFLWRSTRVFPLCLLLTGRDSPDELGLMGLQEGVDSEGSLVIVTVFSTVFVLFVCVFFIWAFLARFPRSTSPYENALVGEFRVVFLLFFLVFHGVANSSELRFRLFYRWHALQFVLPFTRPHLSFVDWTFPLRGPGGYMDC